MRRLALGFALLLAAPLAAQPALDVSAALDGAVTGSGELPVTAVAASGVVSASVAPGLPLGVRGVASAAYGPGDGRGDGRILAAGLGAELPLSGGRNGVYLALGAAAVDFDNDGPTECIRDPECFFEGTATPSYAGLAWTAGVGARVPVGARLYVEPAVSVADWGEVVPSVRLGVGWRLR